MHPTQDLIDFIDASPSAYHAAAEVARRLGFEQRDSYAAPGGHVLVRDGAVIAWWVPENPASFRIVGSHTDSPGYMLAPEPESVREGMHVALVEKYGGPIAASFFDRDLTIAGRIVLADGSERLVDTGAVARIPRLAIHLDRAEQADLRVTPVVAAPVMDLVAQTAGVDRNDILGHELITVDTQRGDVFGEYLCARRMDNLTSVYASLVAFQNAAPDAEEVLVMSAFNHEEIGSQTTSGAAGPLLDTVLSRIADGLGQDIRDMKERSIVVSADAAHAVHPNYPEKHDLTKPVLNGGPVTKVSATKRYASDASTIAVWERACRVAGVPSQTYVGRSGSTIGPITATRTGIPTVDVGVPLLSMHSAREMAGTLDQQWLAAALEQFYLDN